MTNIERFNKYLEGYCAKDIHVVADMFADDIRLRDWKISVQGKQLAVAETQKNFANAESIAIEILSCFTSGNTVAGELKITVDQSEILYVVDVVSFNEQGYISSIKAYIGRED